MHAKRKSVLLALVLMAVMVIPAGYVGAGEQKEADNILPDQVDTGSEDDVSIERVTDDTELSKINERFELPSFEGYELGRTDRTAELEDLQLDTEYSMGTELTRGHNYQIEAPSRASDTSDNDDPFNGSKLAEDETVSGELFFPETDPTGDRGDYIDWYKMELTGIDPTVPGALKNVTFQLNSFDSDEETLYELTYNTEEYTTDFLDFMELYIYHDAIFWGGSEFGGRKFWYDDGDDADGWEYDSETNRTTNFRTPQGSKGTEDTNGAIGGLTEDGWYYIGISFNYYTTADAYDRGDFYIDYEFSVSTESNEANHFPGITTGEGAPNDYWNASSTPSTQVARSHSAMNHFDWYKFQGMDQTKIWNQTAYVNVSLWSLSQPLANGITHDNWLWVYMMWWGAGEDGEFDTDDDIWTVNFKVHYAYLSFQDPDTGEPASFFVWRGDTMDIQITNINNRTDAVAGHPALEGQPRQLFVGLWSEPLKTIETSQGTFQTYSSFQVFNEYELEWNVHEVAPNNPPEMTDITVSSDFEQNETGGYLDTEYTINVTYQDEDNNPPKNIYIVFDDETPAQTAPVDILEEGDPIYLNDQDYTDGKEYQITYLGRDLGEDPFPHGIKVWATDSTDHELKKDRMSLPFYNNNSLFIWDDEPVTVNQQWEGIRNLNEDEPTAYFPMEGFDGAFKDPENDFVSFEIWDKDAEEWVSELDVELMTATMGKVDGIWQLSIDLKENEYSTDGFPIRMRAKDEYSWAERQTRIIVNEVNDPPMVTGVVIDGVTYDEETAVPGQLDNSDPTRPVLRLDDVEEAALVEDTLFEFEILAQDTDKEGERDDLEYDFETGLSDPWKNTPDVGYNTGIVTLPADGDGVTNDDVKKDNSKMAFSITDGRTDGQIILTVYFEVKNKNDPPTLTIPSTTPRQYTQYQSGGIRISPIAQDIDPDETLTYSVNFEEAVGDVDAIMDQLPNMEVTKDIDWGMDPNTGEFWFKPDDQNIWNTSSGWVNDIEINLVFQVEDSEGATATDQITLILKDQNEEPEAPDDIYADPDPSQEVYIDDEIEFSVDPVTDPDGDELTYKWDFGDGGRSEGRVVTNSYNKKGFKTIQAWVEDDQFQTEKISLRLEIEERPDDNDDPEDKNVTNPLGGESEDNNTLLFILAGVAALVIIAVIVILFLVLRKKEAPQAQQYPYDQAAMGAYGAQGLPPGQEGQLPAGGSPELPPGQEQQPQELPPAQQEAPAAQTQAPEAQPETQQQNEAPAGNSCPSCGAQVDPSWFLCPNCKSPLQ